MGYSYHLVSIANPTPGWPCRSKFLSLGMSLFWKAVIEMSSIDLWHNSRVETTWDHPKSSRLWVKTWSFCSDDQLWHRGSGRQPQKNPLDMFSKDPEATETPRFSTSTWVTYLFLPIKIKESAWKHSKNLNMCWIRHYTIYIIYVLYIYIHL